jgi:hypothetical protein
MKGMVLNPALLALLTAWSLPAAAQAPDGLETCRAEPDDARRLACYDRAMDRMARQPDATVAATPAADAPQKLTPEERFGRTGAMNREEMDRKAQESRELGEVHATVEEIWTRADGLMMLTLDNGQIWKQVRPDTTFRLKVGEKVKIQPAALGSFLLSGQSKRSTRVSRVQ